jgi:hypothetical protein
VLESASPIVPFILVETSRRARNVRAKWTEASACCSMAEVADHAFDLGTTGPCPRMFWEWGTPWGYSNETYAGEVGKRRRVLTAEEWMAAASKIDRPPTPDDVSITLDGRRLDFKEKVLEWLAEIEAERKAGMTTESRFDDSDVTE